MSLDLANDALNTHVFCSCVSADGFGFTNLINSKTQLLRRKGFQGERFVRAPVTIQFQFSIPSNIHKIEFYPAVGRQCAKTIQLFSSNSYPVSSDVIDYETDWTDHSQFRRCASASLTERAKVTFLNRGYSPHSGLPRITDKANAIIAFTSGNLSDVTALRISIRQMLTGSVPSIADLHIWGRPAKSCSQVQKNKILRLNRQLKQLACEDQVTSDMFYSRNVLTKSDSDGVVKTLEKCLPYNGTHNRKEESSHVDIPDDMLDPLTLEVMRFPILLPSGHNIDRSTLDKHVKFQSEYGNAASDPFTGILFSESHNPIPNVKLKFRIDEFNLSKLPKQGTSKLPVHYSRHTVRGQNSAVVFTSTSVDDSKYSQGSLSKKRSYATGHTGLLAASLDESLKEMDHNATKRRSLASVREAPPSTLICCKCSSFMFSETARYVVPCDRVICGRCIKDVAERFECPCLLTHELKSIRRTYHE